MSAKHGRYTSLDSKQTSQWNGANMPTPQLPMHRVLCSLVHSHSIIHLNYWNLCRLGCAIMLSATLLAPTRYEAVSKHHAATNVTIITYILRRLWNIEEIGKFTEKYANTVANHDDVINWKYFPRYRPFVRGIHRPPVNSPHKGQWRGALMFSLICTLINAWQTIVRLVIWDAIALIMPAL